MECSGNKSFNRFVRNIWNREKTNFSVYEIFGSSNFADVGLQLSLEIKRLGSRDFKLALESSYFACNCSQIVLESSIFLGCIVTIVWRGSQLSLIYFHLHLHVSETTFLLGALIHAQSKWRKQKTHQYYFVSIFLSSCVKNSANNYRASIVS